MLLTSNYAGLKRKAEEKGLAESLAKVFAKAEEVAAEREERMRKMEIEAEERRREADDRHEERLMTLLAGFMQSMSGHGRQPFQQGYQHPWNHPPSNSYHQPPDPQYPSPDDYPPPTQ